MRGSGEMLRPFPRFPISPFRRFPPMRRALRLLPLLAALLLVSAVEAGHSTAARRPAGPHPPLRLTFLALDHGCVTVLQPPGGTVGLIDAGAAEDAPQLLQFLKRRGIKQLTVLIVTTWMEKYVGGGPA